MVEKMENNYRKIKKKSNIKIYINFLLDSKRSKKYLVI